MAGHALVTGGGGGIGRDAALRLAARGESVSVWDLDGAAAARTVKEIEQAGGSARSVGLDVREQQAVTSSVAEGVEEFGPVTTLVTAAGISKMTDFAGMGLDTWQSMMDIHATGTFLCAQAVAASMVEAGYGRMVFISSMAGISGNAGSVHYAAAKAAIIGFAKALAKELGPSGITVNAIAPGAIDTPMLKLIPQRILDQTVGNPMGRVGLPADVSRAIVFLTEPEADFITGQVLGINGGAYT